MGRSARARGRLLKLDPARVLASSGNAAISYFARRDLLGSDPGPVSLLWELPVARKTVARQNADGSWRYPGGKSHVHSRENYDQLETFRQVGTLVEKFGFTREHTAIARAAEFLFSFQTQEGDFRGIYGNQYATTYVGAIMELLVMAGYAGDPRIAQGFRWLLAMRQSDGGWAIPCGQPACPSPSLSTSSGTRNRWTPTGRSRPPISSPAWCCGPLPPTPFVADPPQPDGQGNYWRPGCTGEIPTGTAGT